MPIYPELATLSLEELIARFGGPAPEGGESAVGFYDEVTLGIRRWGAQGDAFLLASLGTADEDRTRSILFALSSPPLPSFPIAPLVRPFLDDERPMVVSAAIDALAPFAAFGDDAEVLRHAIHDSPYVRGSVLRYLAYTRKKGAAPLLIKALGDAHPIVRHNAIDELGDLCVTEALPAIRRFLDDADPDTRDAAFWAVEQLKVCSDDNPS